MVATAPLRSVVRADYTKLRNERLRTILSRVHGGNVLHVGCVNHRLPQTLQEKENSLHIQLCDSYPDSEILGIDIDEAAISELQRQGFAAEVCDAENMCFKARFDTIIAGELIEHLQNPGKFLEGCRRALRPGGVLVLSTPNIFSVMLGSMYLKNSDHAFNPQHAMWFCPQTILEILRRYDFVVTSFEFVDDLDERGVDSVVYKIFAFTWKAIRWILPVRYRNTMVLVCKPV